MSGNYGKYVLQRKLAEGGMAELFLAKQQGLEGFEKLVVVKRILPQLSADDSFVNMFLNEARVAARLNHPNIVQIFDLGKLDQQYFIAMEYVHGEDLRTVIREAGETRRPPLGLCCRVIADTLGGLHYAHTRAGADGKPLGLVHRDVSPQNVLVTYEGSIKIVDFGIAKATREVGAAQTQAGLLKGKYSYMSPEQARGGSIDARADVFCAGILLWELATWSRLFKRPTEMATLMAVIEERIPPPRAVDDKVPRELDAIIVKALARAPGERFASAMEMRAALEGLIRKQGWEADALALQVYMRELFADKLEAQAADIAAAGMASLEDFLLQVEEKTSISWMAAPEPDKKTPSSGLPMTPPFGSHVIDDEAAPPGARDLRTAADTFDDGPTAKAPEDMVAASRLVNVGPPPPPAPQSPRSPSGPQATIRPPSGPHAPLRPPSGPQATIRPPSDPHATIRPPSGPQQEQAARPPDGARAARRPSSGPQFAVPESQLATVHAATSPHNETPASNAPPPAPAPPTAPPDHITLQPHLPSPHQEATPGPNQPLRVSSPTAATAGATLPPPPLAPQATRISGEQALVPLPPPYGAARATARHAAWIPPSRWRRVLVAGSVAVAVGAIALTAALWPAADPPDTVTPAAVTPTAVTPTAVAPTAVAPAPAATTTKATPPVGAQATLIIDIDTPADIAVDGKPQPRGQSATVNVQPGIEHEVTVQSAGHAARRIHVPALAPGEHMPLRVSLRQL